MPFTDVVPMSSPMSEVMRESLPVAGAQREASTISRRRGPCTPSTRLSSMSDVADGPEMKVTGRRPVRTASPSLRIASGTVPTTCDGPHDADVQVGQQRERPAALALAAVQDDRAGVRDGQRAAGDDAVGGVERLDASPGRPRATRALRTPGRRKVGGDDEPPGAVLGQRRADRRGDVGIRAAPDGRAVLGRALGEPLDLRRRGAAATRPT